MKGPKLIINILLSIALLGISVMVTLNLYPSWSEYARSREEQLLLVTLGSIMSVFFIRGYNYPRRFKTLFMWPVRADVQQVNVWTAFMFLGVICTPVTIGDLPTEILHYAFTLAGILFAYSDIVNYYERRHTRALGWVGFGVAVVGMIGGKFLGLWTLGVGEAMAAFGVAVHILNTNNLIKDS